jgi:hypothetical protein
MALRRVTDKYSQTGLAQAVISFDSVNQDYVIVLQRTGPALADRIPLTTYRCDDLEEAESVAYNAACDLEAEILAKELGL